MSEDRNAPVLLGIGQCLFDTKNACLVDFTLPNVGVQDFWIPKSAIHDDSEVYQRGHKGKVIVQAWWAELHGMVPEKKRPLPMKPPSKKWLRDQKARMTKARR